MQNNEFYITSSLLKLYPFKKFSCLIRSVCSGISKMFFKSFTPYIVLPIAWRKEWMIKYCLIKICTCNFLWHNRCQNTKQQHSCSVALPTLKLVVFAVSQFCDMQLYITVYKFLCCFVRNLKFSASIMYEFPHNVL